MADEIINNEEQVQPPVIEKVSLSEIKDEQEKVIEGEIESLISEALNLIHNLTPEEKAELDKYLNK